MTFLDWAAIWAAVVVIFRLVFREDLWGQRPQDPLVLRRAAVDTPLLGSAVSGVSGKQKKAIC